MDMSGSEQGVTCPNCGIEGDEFWIQRHQSWCKGVEDLIDSTLDGESTSPNAATAHQFCEALNRISQRHLSADDNLTETNN